MTVTCYKRDYIFNLCFFNAEYVADLIGDLLCAGNTQTRFNTVLG